MTTMEINRKSLTCAEAHRAEGPGGVFLVELTDLGFRIRHGRYGDYGRGLWSSRFHARHAADCLARGEYIAPNSLADHHVEADGTIVAA